MLVLVRELQARPMCFALFDTQSQGELYVYGFDGKFIGTQSFAMSKFSKTDPVDAISVLVTEGGTIEEICVQSADSRSIISSTVNLVDWLSSVEQDPSVLYCCKRSVQGCMQYLVVYPAGSLASTVAFAGLVNK